MKSDLVMHELRNTSSVFGRKSDIRVVFHGTDAVTNGDTIVLPELIRSKDVEDDTAKVLRGYVDHEAGHIRHSDMDLLQRTYDEWLRHGKALLKAVHNAVEDVWLEGKVLADYPGADVNLRATATAVNQSFLDAVEAGKITEAQLADPKFVGAVAITWEGRKHYAGVTCDDCLDKIKPGLRKVLPKWIEKVHACADTKATIELAKTIYNAIMEEDFEDDVDLREKKRKHGDASEGGDGKGERSKGEGPRKVTSAFTPGGSEMSDPIPEDRSLTKDDELALDETDEDEDRTHRTEPEKTDEDVEDPTDKPLPDHTKDGKADPKAFEDFGVDKALEGTLTKAKLKGTPGDRRSYYPFSTEADKWHHRTFDTAISQRLAKTDATRYDLKLSAMSGVVNSMRRRLERALMSKQTRDWDTGREQGRLDPKRFVSVLAGKRSVFKERTERAEMDTAITFLVDLSGSMHYKVGLARDCVMALVEAIDKTGIAYEVVGFSNRKTLPSGWRDQINAGIGRGYTYGRVEPLDMTIFKSFDERLFNAKGPLYDIANSVGEENSDGEALLYAYARLKARAERRKVFVTLSDGSPACVSYNHSALNQHLRDTVEMIQRDGTQIMGIGMMDGSVSRFYPAYVVVERLEDLAGQALTLLAKQLMGDRVTLDHSQLMAVS